MNTADETGNIVTDGRKPLLTDYGSTTPSSDEKELELELNKIYQLIGLGPFQYLCWLLVALVAYSDYSELVLLSVILPSLRCEWDLSPLFEAAITISVYGSYAIFSVLFGKIADKYGRKTVIKWATLVLLFAAIAGANSPNKWVFLTTTAITGACIGTNLSCIICYGTEYAESKYRAYGCTTFTLSAAVSSVIVSGLAFLLLNFIGWRWFMIIVALPAIPAVTLMFLFPDSPRFLCVSGQQEEAMAAVRFMATLNRKKLPENIRMTCFQDEATGSYSMILNKEHRRSTIALSVIYFGNIFVEFGLIVLLPLLFSSHLCGTVNPTDIEKPCQTLTQDELREITIATSGSIFGIVAGLFFAQFIGRLMGLRAASFAMIFSIGSLFLCVNETFTVVASTILKVLEAVVNSIIWIVIPETFPTTIRSTATGFINGWGKMGGLVGTGCVYLLFYVSPYSVIAIFLSFSFIAFGGTVVFKKEMKGEVLKET
jgi:MFS family permease